MRPIWAEINLDAYAHNLCALKNFCGVPLLCVLKADGYGHGAPLLASVIESLPARDFPLLGVARVDEGALLREAGVTRPILLLSAILREEAPRVLEAGLTPTIFTSEVARALQVEAQKRDSTINVQVKIDTGMHRLGVPWLEAPGFVRGLKEFDRLRVEGIYTHFACADSDASFTERQRRRFLGALSQCEIDWDERPLLHASNSAGAIRFPHARFDLARPGIASFGLWPSDEMRATRPVDLRAVMSLRARITHLKMVPRGSSVSYGAMWRAPRPSRIATVSAGYADGVPRLSSGQAQVLVGGVRAPVVGRVTMDQVLVDVTDLPAHLGQVVTLWGRDGNEEISADEVAGWAQTIGYEIVCGVAPRVPRVAISGE